MLGMENVPSALTRTLWFKMVAVQLEPSVNADELCCAWHATDTKSVHCSSRNSCCSKAPVCVRFITFSPGF